MKKFIYRVLITFVAVFLLALGLDVFITNNLRHSDARLFQSWNDLYYGNMQCDVIIMGSSRGQVQYDPCILDSILSIDCYNISVDGRCIDAQVVKYNTYCCYNPKPKLIIQNIDFGALALSNGYEREQFLPYLRDDLLYHQTKASESFSWADRYFPLLRYAGYIQVIKEGLGLPNKLNKEVLYKGYCGRDELWDGHAFNAKQSVEFCRELQALRIFDDYLALCRGDDVKVVLVFAPIYIGVTQKMENPEEMFEVYQSFADKYGYPILNYTYDPLSYDTVYFYNATHLNKRGAELFSKQLAEDIKKLNLL